MLRAITSVDIPTRAAAPRTSLQSRRPSRVDRFTRACDDVPRFLEFSCDAFLGGEDLLPDVADDEKGIDFF